MSSIEAVAGQERPADAVAEPVIERSIYRSVPLWLLMVISTLCILDRQIMNILAESIKRDLHLSDAELGMMTGLAFALLYAILGIPVARFADRHRTNRAKLVAVSLIVWSAMTALCGVAQNFGQMFAARVGVGAGEAGSTPPSHSLISDLVPPRKRAAALSFYGFGHPLGIMLGMALGGGLADLFGWRGAFLLLGVPGIVIGLIAWVAVPEPRKLARAFSKGAVPAEHVHPSLRSVLAEIGASRAFRYLLAAMVIVTFISTGRQVWQAVFLIRVHGLSPGIAGLWLGLMYGVSQGVGTWLGGACATWFGSIRRQHTLTATVIGLVVSIPLSLLSYWVADWRLSIALMLGYGIAVGLTYGPTFSCLQGLVRPGSRGAAVALFLLVQNFLGLGFGPMLYGVVSDLLRPEYGVESVRYVLYLSILLVPAAAWCFWRASTALDAELRD